MSNTSVNTTEKPKSKFSIGKFITNWASVAVTIIVFIFFAVKLGSMFLQPSNMVTILRSISVTTVIGIGLTFTLSSGGFDLSSGSMATMAGTFVICFMCWYQMSMWLAIPLAIVLCVALSVIMLLLIVKFHVPDLLASLAMMFILQGLSLIYSGGGAVSQGLPQPNGKESLGIISETFKKMGMAPAIIIIMLVIVALTHIFLNYTKFGRYIYATGGNKEAARLSGIPVNRYRVYAGLISVAFIALGGVLVASRNMSAQMQGAEGYSMPAISAVFIGRSVAGAGKPNAIGTLIGATLVGILENGLVMMSVPYYALNAVKGIVLAVALASAYYNDQSAS